MALKNVYQLYYQGAGQSRPVVEYVYAGDESTARSKLAARHPSATIKEAVFEYLGSNGFMLGSLGAQSSYDPSVFETCIFHQHELRLEDVLHKSDLAELQADL